ncbi:MAG TPA: hypothetical protein VG326_14350 [Tepidisphaeraceae bacterium]|jgi:hypothetical protein|nr:hypothetical protein [Tepidisphaeraceae bacterium]
MSQLTANPGPVLSGSVEMDLPCRQCSYNLRGLPLDGQCPECATPVGLSVNGDLLRYSEPEFIGTLRRGFSFILWGVLALVIVTVGAAILNGMRVVGVGSPVISVLSFFGTLPMVIGAWLLTTPDPGGIGEDRYGAARKFIRITLAIGLLNHLIAFIAKTAGPLTPGVRILFSTFELIVTAIGFSGNLAQLAYLRKLAMRLPDPSLAERARTLIWGFCISYGVLLVVGYIPLLMMGASGKLAAGSATSGIMLFGCVTGVSSIAVLVFGVMYLFMLGRFGERFEEQAAFAKSLWSRAKAGGGAGRASSGGI